MPLEDSGIQDEPGLSVVASSFGMDKDCGTGGEGEATPDADERAAAAEVVAGWVEQARLGRAGSRWVIWSVG